MIKVGKEDFLDLLSSEIKIVIKDPQILGRTIDILGILCDVDDKRIKINFSKGGFRLISMDDILEVICLI